MGSEFRKLYLNCTFRGTWWFYMWLTLFFYVIFFSLFLLFAFYSFIWSKYTRVQTHSHACTLLHTSSPSFISLPPSISFSPTPFIYFFLYSIVIAVVYFHSFILYSCYFAGALSFIYNTTTMCIAGNGNVSMLTEQLRV